MRHRVGSEKAMSHGMAYTGGNIMVQGLKKLFGVEADDFKVMVGVHEGSVLCSLWYWRLCQWSLGQAYFGNYYMVMTWC